MARCGLARSGLEAQACSCISAVIRESDLALGPGLCGVAEVDRAPDGEVAGELGTVIIHHLPSQTMSSL